MFFGVDNKLELILDSSFEINFDMDAPEGLFGGEGSKILSYLHESMLPFSWNAPPSIPKSEIKVIVHWLVRWR